MKIRIKTAEELLKMIIKGDICRSDFKSTPSFIYDMYDLLGTEADAYKTDSGYYFDGRYYWHHWQVEVLEVELTVEQIQDKLGYKIKIVEGIVTSNKGESK